MTVVPPRLRLLRSLLVGMAMGMGMAMTVVPPRLRLLRSLRCLVAVVLLVERLMAVEVDSLVVDQQEALGVLVVVALGVLGVVVLGKALVGGGVTFPHLVKAIAQLVPATMRQMLQNLSVPHALHVFRS